MSLHDNEQRLQDYLDGTLPAPERTDLEAHCRSCSECRTALEEARAAHQALSGLTLKAGPDLTAPIMDRLSRLPAPGRPGPGPLRWAPVLIGGAIALAVGLMLAFPPAPGPARNPTEQAGPAVTPPPEPASAPVVTPLVPAPVAPPPVFLAKAAGSWTPAALQPGAPVPAGTRMMAGPTGTLEFSFQSRGSPHAPETHAAVLLLPETSAVIEPTGLRLEQGMACLRIGRPGKPSAPFTIRHGSGESVTGQGRIVLTVGPQGMEASVFEGHLELSPGSGRVPVKVEALETVRVTPGEVKVDPMAAQAAFLWRPNLPGDPPTVAPSGAGTPAAGLASLTEPAPASLSEDAGPGTASPDASSAGGLDDTLFRHQPN
ncbi:MAG: hypothetical protein GX442_16215 [Candidatus Riflebacteria bacterium]|nr:hypothetical protein [Candidatus Riflebacteria bacterium]